MDRLSIPSSQADQQALLKSVLENTKITQQGVDKLGVNLLQGVKSRVAQTVSSTTYVKLTEFQAAFVTSGGLILIVFSPIVAYNALTLSVQIQVDDASVKEFF